MVELKHMPLNCEMAFWTEKGKEAIINRTFQPVAVGYWKPGMAIIQEQGSRHFCLAFPPPATKEAMASLCTHLKLQLLYNNAGACLYVGGQKIKGGKSDRALVVVGDNGEEKVCWITPFKLNGEETEFFETVTTEPENFNPWDRLLPTEEDVNPLMENLIQDLHSFLLLKETLSEDGREVREFFKNRGEPNQFPGVASEEVFNLCILYIASRMEMESL